MGLVLGALTPHPPIIIPEIGGLELEKVKSTVDSLRKLAKKLKEIDVKRLIIITPHNIVLGDALGVLWADGFKGSLGQFGGPRDFSYPSDRDFVERFVREAQDKRLPVDFIRNSRLDHGTLVPLYYLLGVKASIPIVVLSFAFLPSHTLYEIGAFLEEFLSRDPVPTCIIASGDLSHRLTHDAPAGYSPQGREFDRRIVEIIKGFRKEDILNMDPYFLEEAGECGYRPIVILFGAFDKWEVKTEILSYEGPFGVGYCVAAIYPQRRLVWEEHPLVRLARKAVESYVKQGKVISPPPPSELTPEMKERAGVFVSIKKKGKLRGCIGTYLPTCRNVAEEVIRNAIAACSEDPRFDPVREDELPLLEYSVDILTEPEPVDDLAELDPKLYGVIVEASDGRKGLLLPDLEGVDTVEEQIEIASRKAGILPGESKRIYKFTVRRYK
ncbi:MAG: AmmeMemoRadiSam system protein A [Synergistetes bacterium]|nr:AmmeMemoRadiSam system protein A [Synergistota bacterium]MCX8127207.1 AmmeMemoRadiSam system protein A [Synergistota bacterium]MDW8191907.1 AmmeMemoRadiSam system protein A [Synergistota bacterium]